MTNSLMISSSGIRGIIGESMTPELAVKVAKSYGKLIGKGPVICGGDTRVSHDMVMSSVIAGLTSVGTDVICVGRVTTPTVQQMISAHHAKGGVVVTASHNPVQWNGIKLMNETGSFLTKDEFDAFLSHYDSDQIESVAWPEIGAVSYDDDALSKHIDKILSCIDVSVIKDANLNILVDANNGTGALADPILLDKLGVRYTILNPESHGRFAHDPEPLKQNLSEIIAELSNGDYDIGFVQDADADRLVILDETGHFIGEDNSLAFCVDHILGHEEANVTNKQVVVNLSTSNVIQFMAEKYNATLFQTKIGEPNVTAKLKEVSATVGGEGNGGVIYPKIGWGRDSLVGIVVALKHLAMSQKKVSDVIKTYPKFIMVRDKFTVSSREQVQQFLDQVKTQFQDEKCNTEDGVKVIFENAWLHARPSNTEPIVRIFVEAPNQEIADQILEKVGKISH